MAGYLSKIVDRTLGLLPVAHPLIPPLFGTGPELAEPATRPTLESEQLAQHEPVQQEGQQRAPAARPVEVARPRMDQQARPPEQPPAAPQPLTPHASVTRPVVHRTVAPRLVPATPEESSMPSTSLPAGPPATPAATNASAPDLSRPKDQLIPFIDGESTLAAPDASSAQVQLVSPGMERPLPEARPSHTLVPISEPVKVQLQSLSPDLVTEKSGEAQSAAPDQVPTIQVSIGRVEVCAVFKPPSAPAQTGDAPRPKISLDEYLRSNSGGAR